MNTDIFKPCPFCGGPVRTTYRRGEYEIRCPECKIFVRGKSAREMRDKWNRRPPNQAKQEIPEPEIRLRDVLAAHCKDCRYYGESFNPWKHGKRKICRNLFSSKTEVDADDWCRYFQR